MAIAGVPVPRSSSRTSRYLTADILARSRCGEATGLIDSYIYESDMKTTIQKWGNSLVVRIPRPFAEEIHLEENTVDLTIKPAITLESLVEQITDENRHDEIGTGRRVRSEVW
jgi:antitoxin MazE